MLLPGNDSVCKQPLSPRNGQLWYVCFYSEGCNATIRACFSTALRNGDVPPPQAHLFPCRLQEWVGTMEKYRGVRGCLPHGYCMAASFQALSNQIPTPARSSALQMVQLQTQLWNEPGNTMCKGLGCQAKKVHPGICKTCTYEIR